MHKLICIMPNIIYLMDEWVKSFNISSNESLEHDDPIKSLVHQLHHFNFLLWNNEDEARRSDLDDAVQVRVKRESHRLNQARNDAIEKIDEWLLANAYGQLINLDLQMRTETPGSVLDRLSILSLKIHNMKKQANRRDVSEMHQEVCRKKLDVLQTQKADLVKSLLEMFDDLDKGRIKMKIYRQFKMYNDPSLNPSLYSNSK